MSSQKANAPFQVGTQNTGFLYALNSSKSKRCVVEYPRAITQRTNESLDQFLTTLSARVGRMESKGGEKRASSTMKTSFLIN